MALLVAEPHVVCALKEEERGLQAPGQQAWTLSGWQRPREGVSPGTPSSPGLLPLGALQRRAMVVGSVDVSVPPRALLSSCPVSQLHLSPVTVVYPPGNSVYSPGLIFRKPRAVIAASILPIPINSAGPSKGALVRVGVLQ